MVEKKSLSEQELAEQLAALAPEWKTGKNEKGVPYIERVKHAAKYMEGIEFVNRVARLAEDNNHHPDMFIHYKRITVRYWTHSASGVTLADVQMAAKVDTLF